MAVENNGVWDRSRINSMQVEWKGGIENEENLEGRRKTSLISSEARCRDISSVKHLFQFGETLSLFYRLSRMKWYRII